MLLARQVSGSADGAVAVGAGLLDRVLTPYKTTCRYLLDATVRYPRAARSIAAASGTFSIPESCYIASTGHFNAVEFNICYNQIVYFSIAKAVQERLSPAFEGWTLEDFWRRQLPDIRISGVLRARES